MRCETVVVAALSTVIASAPTGCSSVVELERDPLAQVVERDGVAFDGTSIPATVVDRLAAHRLVVLGEQHFLREHRELVVALLQALHARGFRQLLLEWPQMADCLVADYLAEEGVWPDWQPTPGLGGSMIEAIRDFNRSLPAAQRIEVHGIDVNLTDYGGVDSFLDIFRTIHEHLGRPDALEGLAGREYEGEGPHRSRLEAVREELVSARSALREAWGDRWYGTVAEMVDVELASVGVRVRRRSDYDASVRIRETEMKRLADLRLRDRTGGTVLNVGGNHAQKAYLKGTEQEWLGDYLVHRSEAVGGTIIVVATRAVRVVGGSPPEYELGVSPENELFRIMTETWPGRSVFLGLDDPIFQSEGVALNFEEEIFVAAPKRIYDAFLLYPSARFVPPL